MHNTTTENSDQVVRGQNKNITIALWTLVGAGIAIRLVNPFLSNPLDFLVSDPLRHFMSAKDCLQTGINPGVVYEILDPLGYQVWLSSVLRVTAGDRTAIAIYTALLSIVTPWIWYRWMRLALPGKQLALAGYAVLSLLPDWIKLYQFFLQETLLLPLVGLSLWISWRTEQRPSAGRFITSGLAWGFALMTKLTALPAALVTLIWLYVRFKSNKSLRLCSLAAIAIALSLFSLSALKIYNRTHAVVPFPPGDYHRIWYESGKKDLRFTIKFLDNQQGYKEYLVEAGNPSLDLQMKPVLDWETARKDTCDLTIDLTQTPDKYLPNSNMSVQDRLRYTGENIMYFFFGLSWPENFVEKDKQLGAAHTWLKASRFIWMPITLAIAFLAIQQKRRDILVVLFAVTVAFFMFQQSIILEARYKKPWEGIAVATLLSLIASNSSQGRRATKNALETTGETPATQDNQSS